MYSLHHLEDNSCIVETDRFIKLAFGVFSWNFEFIARM